MGRKCGGMGKKGGREGLGGEMGEECPEEKIKGRREGEGEEERDRDKEERKERRQGEGEGRGNYISFLCCYNKLPQR